MSGISFGRRPHGAIESHCGARSWRALSHDRLHKYLVQLKLPFVRARKLSRMPSLVTLNLVGNAFVQVGCLRGD